MIRMRYFIPSDANHFDAINEHTAELVTHVEPSDHAWTILSNDIPVCIWGYQMLFNDRHHFWALMAKKSATNMHGILRCGLDQLNRINARRMEATVVTTFRAGVKFIERLGFHREGTLESFYDNGDDAFMYARIGRAA